MYRFKLIAIILIFAVLFCGCVSEKGEAPQERPAPPVQAEPPAHEMVYIAPYGTKFHLRATCAGKNAMEIALEALSPLYEPCKKCAS